MDKKQEFIDNLSEYFISKSYKKKGNTFLADNGKSVSIFNLQKSAYKNSIFLNIGLYFKDKENNRKIDTIKILDAHFTGRYYSILGLKGDAFDIDAIENISNLTNDIILNIENEILPFLFQLSSIDYVKKIIQSKNLPWDKIWLQNVTGEELLKLIESN